MSENNINIAFIEDIQLIRDSFKKLLYDYNPNCKFVLEASNGLEFIDKLKDLKTIPELAIIDLEMPIMDGKETVKWIKKNHPSLKTLILTQKIDDASIVSMMRMRVDAYLSKDINVAILSEAIEIIMKNGKYYPEIIESKYNNYVNNQLNVDSQIMDNGLFTELDLRFIKLACSNLTNRELSNLMSITESAVEGYCNRVYKKMGVTNRAGMIIYAIKHKLVNFDDI
jgi:two-component system, NarL family, invasion response regulator UvrY